ncbi:MAG: hypothetical protein QNK11_07815 [Legionella sp.]|nr:hypothetical protein [Legionella sp.]
MRLFLPVTLKPEDKILILTDPNLIDCTDAFKTLGISIEGISSIEWGVFKRAANKVRLKAHPDKGGDPEDFRKIQ